MKSYSDNSVTPAHLAQTASDIEQKLATQARNFEDKLKEHGTTTGSLKAWLWVSFIANVALTLALKFL